ncbi:MAG: ATP-dependent RNA helicase HrpA [Limisphaerales bacterium]
MGYNLRPVLNDPRIQELRQLLPQAMLPDWVRLGLRANRLLRDRLHPDKHDAVLQRLLEQARASVALREERQRAVPVVSYPPDLPITARKDEIVAAIRAHPVVVIAGETGSGKTTQLPKMCLEAGLGIRAKIGCTQPRRVAALSISRRIAEELNVQWGRQVGCKIRFDDRSSPQTYIKLMTDGILLAEAQGDPQLSEYEAILIDEAHERSLNIDFLLGHLKGLLARRPDLKLIITSATIDTESFAKHFNDAPIIEVSGRMYPVEVVYQPLAAASEEQGDVSYVDAAVEATERVLIESDFGDVLIFLPGERDIREARDQLEGRLGREAEIIPLFGRLSAGEQQRAFAPGARRKVVVATNIAETSLTIPGIRFVIDAGLARISRYNPRTRTRRLPIEPVSQSSANQRKGRAGRVQAGVCLRLYAEDDFAKRPAFTQPEIQRANLAEVILRMKAFGLGDIETFPFLQPPTPAAIAAGYALLQELGALDAQRALTGLGRDLARLPIDPTLGRMLLQAQREHATREVLIIAAGLSIQDPRERPLDQQAAANAAHQRFTDPTSDFLTLLNIWNAVHDEWEKLPSQNQRRKFCQRHFLSYVRMREWQDLHAQLEDALSDLPRPVGRGEGRGEELGQPTVQNSPRGEHAKRGLAPHPQFLSPSDGEREAKSHPAYAAIHRSILAGLVGHVARREERNRYKASGNRRVTVFPGSALFVRGEKPAKGRPASPAQPTTPEPKSSQPEWVVAGEVVETSQLFIRTLAGIEPEWIYELAPHCCKVAHQHPRWDAKSRRVIADEVVTFQGLEVQRKRVAYGNIAPKEAAAIFIRAALVEVEEDTENPERETRNARFRPSDWAGIEDGPAPRSAFPAARSQYRFLEHNRAVRQRIEDWQRRTRHHGLVDLDQALCDFYAARLGDLSSFDELNRLLRERPDQSFLCATEADLVGDLKLDFNATEFPEAVELAGQPLTVRYAYAPGEEWDGVTVQMPVELARSLPGAAVAWAVPGLRREQVAELLRSLPKSLRRELQPLEPKIEEIVRELQPSGAALTEDLARFLHRRYGVAVPAEAWKADAVPAHLRPRIEVVDAGGRAVVSGRELAALRDQLRAVPTGRNTENADWRRAAARWERVSLSGWTFGDLPERIVVGGSETSAAGPPPVFAWPGLAVEDGHVSVRLFRSAELAREAGVAGLQRLLELVLQKDLAWLENDLRALHKLAPLYAPIGSAEELRETAAEHLRNHVLGTEPLPALREAEFHARVAAARQRLAGLVPRFCDQLEALLQLRQQVALKLGASQSAAPGRPASLKDFRQLAAVPVAAKPPHPLQAELDALLPARFLVVTPHERLPHLARYLKALGIRAERAALNPVKDRERARQLAPFVTALRQWQAKPPASEEGRRRVEAFRWLVEEFKVSLFAQELGTAETVSVKRLEQALAGLHHAG